jgi:hypothetical protein
MKKLLGIFALIGLISLPAAAQLKYPVSVATLSTASGTCETSTASAVSTTASGSGGVDISGTWTGTLAFYAKIGDGNGYVPVSLTPVGGTTAVPSTTANGEWTGSVAGYTGLCVAFTPAAVTGAARVQVNSSPASSGSSGGGGGAITGTVTANKPPWVTLWDSTLVAVTTTSPHLTTGGYTELIVYQTGAAGPLGNNVLNSIDPTPTASGAVQVIASKTASTGDNGRYTIVAGPTANGLMTGAPATWPYTLPPLLQFVTASNGRYIIYAR